MAKPRLLPAFGIITLLSTWLGLGLFAPAQETRPSSTAPATQSAAPTSRDLSRESDPLKILWLKNPATGELVPVPGLTIQEYDKLDRLRRGLPPEATAPPNYLLTDLRLSGKATRSAATCDLSLEVELRDDRWARIPIGLAHAAIRSAPAEENWLVTPDTGSEGFVLWAKGKAGDKKKLELAFSFPLETKSESTRFHLGLPRARASSAELTIEGDEAGVRMESAGTLDSSKFAAGVNEIRCSGFAGNLDLSWRPKAQPSSAASWLEAFGLVEIRVDGRRQIRTDAKLRIRTFGLLSQPLRIKLPRGMRISPDAATISSFVQSQSISNAPSDGANLASQILELTIDPAAPSDFELRIQAETDGPIAANASELSLDGFEVINAKRHWGTVDLFLTSDWFASATQSPEIRRIDIDAGVNNDPAFSRSRFEYASQGASIAVSARLPRTLVEPAYDVYIESNQLRLDGQFKYRFRGPSTGAVEIDLGDWELERVSSPDATFLVEDVQQVGSRLLVPLSPQPLVSGAEANLRVEARRIGEEKTAIFRLPAPKASVETPAVVRVLSDVNLGVTARPDELKGVSIDTSAPLASSASQRGQLVYRTRPGPEAPQLAFDIQIRKQSILQALLTQLTVANREAIGIHHEIQLLVAYEPLREVTIDFPVDLSEIDTVRVMIDEQPMERMDATELVSPEEPGRIWTRCRFGLPQSYLGPLKLVCEYSFSASAAPSTTAVLHLDLPKLVTMGAITSKPHQLLLRDPNHLIEIDSSNWSRELFDEPSRSTSPPSERFSSLKPQHQVSFQLSEIIAKTDRQNRCERWWLQSLLASGVRSDRLCMRMSSWSAPLTFRLPKGLVNSSVIAAVDGVEIAEGSVSDGEITLSNPHPESTKPQVIELWYRCEIEALRLGSTTLPAPQVDGVVHSDILFWQLLAPRDWYSLIRPTGWNLEPTATLYEMAAPSETSAAQATLEKWIGASKQQAMPIELNQYLFSALSAEPELTLVLAPRREVWLVLLSLAFVLSVLFVYLSSFRSPLGLLAVISTVAVVIVFEPSWSGAVVQFLTITLTVALSIWLLRRMLGAFPTLPPRPTPSRSGVRPIEATPHPSESAAARRGSSISGAPAPAGPTP